MRYAAITGWGMAVPDRVLTNADLEKLVDTTDEWIVSRTGIKERHVVGTNDSTTSLAVTAARQALDRAGLTADDIDLIIVGTCTPDQFLVSQACLVQAEIGGNAGAFDLGAACSGFVYALSTGSQFVQTGAYDRVLVIGVDTLTRFVDYSDRTTCILFGDGAGAFVIEASDQPRGLLSTVLGADGAGSKHLYIPGWGAFVPETAGIFPEYRPYLQMNGNEVFRFAVRVMGDAAAEAVEQAGLQFSDIDLLIPHVVLIFRENGSGSTSIATATPPPLPSRLPSVKPKRQVTLKKATISCSLPLAVDLPGRRVSCVGVPKASVAILPVAATGRGDAAN
jgi:3-oxoacyl-[acyl-carrier-protein] synthase-3